MTNDSFTVSGNTPIGWGKFKGRRHVELLLKENEGYKRWIVNQGPEFRYKATRDWILSKELADDDFIVEDNDDKVFKIISNTTPDKFKEVLLKVQSLLDSDEHKGLTIHKIIN